MNQPIPPGWYPNPTGQPGTQYWDGHQWATIGPPMRKRSVWPWVLVGAVVFFFAGCGALLVVGASISDIDEDSAVTSSVQRGAPIGPPDATAEATAEPSVPAAVPRIGEEARDGKFAFVVNSMDTSSTAGEPSNEFMTVEAQGMFVNVRLTVTNIGHRAQTFYADNQKLMAGGREYSVNTMAAIWSGAANEEINPGNSIDVVLSFDVPRGITHVDTVELHDSAFSNGVTVSLA
ncbi:DUF4352 domain-containing protein [Mycobacterium spongiae]|uniref:DUF4352 domain-containing protein n=1 Tax=Mycobacterium spongiae TaxID=886343 RepID=A0A975PY52_9MYCO|nr:DUF4352 domain-containing protein [Mycobacterium spongiae]QUR68951.1 DUF4352 domain-containing protein [Mycobacterium spongiae]